MGKRILVVDDDKTVLVWVSEMLLKKEYEVDVAINGVIALDKIKKNKPDLVITDVLMPQMDGFQLFKELKKNKETAQILVLVQTGRKMLEDSFSVMGVKDFLSKPCKVEELYAKIGEMLARTGISEETIVLPKENVAAAVEVNRGLETADDKVKHVKQVKQSVLVMGSVIVVLGLIVFSLLKTFVNRSKENPNSIASQVLDSADVESSLEGEINEYDEEKRLRSTMFYDKGKLKWRKTYDEQGNLTADEHF